VRKRVQMRSGSTFKGEALRSWPKRGRVQGG
jgi:hypothetical protein